MKLLTSILILSLMLLHQETEATPGAEGDTSCGSCTDDTGSILDGLGGDVLGGDLTGGLLGGIVGGGDGACSGASDATGAYMLLHIGIFATFFAFRKLSI